MTDYLIDDPAADRAWEFACDLVARRHPGLDQNCDEFDRLVLAELEGPLPEESA